MLDPAHVAIFPDASSIATASSCVSASSYMVCKIECGPLRTTKAFPEMYTWGRPSAYIDSPESLQSLTINLLPLQAVRAQAWRLLLGLPGKTAFMLLTTEHRKG